ncbi:hypothetical protein SLS58_005852 [Diplodia intermedia]|uniref:RNA-dependent RNA polymerase n=1 Tax=Diplodia intermedia TaxID=856260 RepID=A0ABR3TQ12_9PEZI
MSRNDSTTTDSIWSRDGDKTANTSFATTVDASQPEKEALSQPESAYPALPEIEHPAQPDKVQQEFPSSGNYSLDTDISWPSQLELAKETANEQTEETVNEPTVEKINEPTDETINEPTNEARFVRGDPLEKLIEKSTYASMPSSVDIISSAKPQEHHQSKALPRGGLFVPEIGAKLMKMEFKYRWEFLRVALEAGIQPDILLPRDHNEEWNEYSCLWDYFRHHDALGDSFGKMARSSEKAWNNAGVIVEGSTVKAFENITLKVKLSFTDKNHGPIFKLRLQPLQLEETSCRFQRAFGGDRFLYLETPKFQGDRLPEHLKGQLEAIEERFPEWLGAKGKRFLGRKWETIHVEPIGDKKKSKGRAQDEGRGYRVILFATSGNDIDSTKETGKIRSGTRRTMSVYDLVNWFMPLDKNANQRYLKAFARISLGLTTTLPALEFKPSQVRFVGDIKANNEHEAREFNDTTISWPVDEQTSRVMNDGCSRISVGAARLLWKNTNKDGPIPSTFQGRIGGAKGMWMLSASPDTTEAFHCKTWIEVSDSQVKFEPHEDDTDSDYDPLRFTFDLHSTTGTAEPSSVYLSFFPILHDRGVPVEALRRTFEDHFNKERYSLLEATKNPVHLRKWVNKQNSLAEERAREDVLSWQGGLPLQLQEKVILLLESGFDTSCEYLANVTQRLVARSLRLLRQNVRVPLPRCTYIKGVADPSGILAPGEIHVHFTKSFIDEASGECLSFLDNRQVIVARNPALRRSDIQKVRACFKLELSHLKDVVVFPTRGSFPLAGKLQGGDYDGDTFWVCWEPDLVAPFKNAPPPLDDPVPERYGIKVDRRTLEEMKRPRSIGRFMRESFRFHCKPSLLGLATKVHERVYYTDNNLVSDKAEVLADLHDLLVDHSKNGYEFNGADFDAFRAKFGIPKDLPCPAYEQAREQDRDEKKLNKAKKKRSGKKQPTGGATSPGFKKDSILDRLYFETIEPHTHETLRRLEDCFQAWRADPALDVDVDVDPALEQRFLDEQREAAKNDDAVMAEELALLVAEMKQLGDAWNVEVNRHKNKFGAAGLMAADVVDAKADHGGINGNGNGNGNKKNNNIAINEDLNDPDQYNKAVDVCHPRFRAYRPQLASQHPVIRRWQRFHDAKTERDAQVIAKNNITTTAVVPSVPSEWELLRASALYHVCGAKWRYKRRRGLPVSSAFAFHMAGWELCWQKACSVGAGAGGARLVVLDMWANLKPRRVKLPPAAAAAARKATAGWATERGASRKGRDGERRFGGDGVVDCGGGGGGDGGGGGGGDGDETEYASAAEEIGGVWEDDDE